MGRAKRKLNLLNNQKERCRTFERRMKGLKKKAHELKTLCDVEVCLIVDNEPKAEKCDHRIVVPQIWPSDPNLIKNLIISHRNQPADGPSSSSDLFTFLKVQNDKIKKEIIILKGKNEEDMYPAWDDSYNVLSREKLEEFGGLISQKIQFLKTRIEGMRCSSSSFFHGPEQSSFQNQRATQNEFYFPLLISSKQYEAVNSFNSSNQTSIACGSSGGVTSLLVLRPSNGFHEPEPPTDSNYFQNNLYCSGPISCIYPEAENSSISFGNKFFAENQVAELSTENDVCYNQFEDLFSNEYLNGFMDCPISENSDHSIANIEGCFDMSTQFVSHSFEDLKAENLALDLERSSSTEWNEFVSFK